MREFKNVRQPEEGRRRLFIGEFFRLYVWYDYAHKSSKRDERIVGFELTYGGRYKGIVRYTERTNYLTHNHLIDDERSEVLSMSDMYGEDKGRLSKHVFELFEAETLPPSIKNYVISNLQKLL